METSGRCDSPMKYAEISSLVSGTRIKVASTYEKLETSAEVLLYLYMTGYVQRMLLST